MALEGLLPAPGCPVMSWASRSAQLAPDAAAGGKSRAEPTDRQPPCLLLQPASSHLNLSPLRPTLHPGCNVSRSCTEAGWTPLEPGPYPVACGLDDNSSSVDEVGLHAPHTHTHTHTSARACCLLPLSPTKGHGCPLCRSQDSWHLPSPSFLPLQAHIPLAPLKGPGG